MLSWDLSATLVAAGAPTEDGDVLVAAALEMGDEDRLRILKKLML